jgi:hypothetical protein
VELDLVSGRINQGVSVVLGSMLMISLAVASGSLLYNYSISTVQSYEQPAPATSLLEVTTGTAIGMTIRFFVINLGKSDILLNGSDRVYVTTPNGSEYTFSQISAFAQETIFSSFASSNSTSIIFHPSETVCFIVDTPFATSAGGSYSILLTLGDGSETISTIRAS